MRVLTVNIGKPRPNPWKGVGATGIDKQPVETVPLPSRRPKGTADALPQADRESAVRRAPG